MFIQNAVKYNLHLFSVVNTNYQSNLKIAI